MVNQHEIFCAIMHFSSRNHALRGVRSSILWRPLLSYERQSVRMSKITNEVGLTRSGTGCFIAVLMWQQGYKLTKSCRPGLGVGLHVWTSLGLAVAKRQTASLCWWREYLFICWDVAAPAAAIGCGGGAAAGESVRSWANTLRRLMIPLYTLTPLHSYQYVSTLNFITTFLPNSQCMCEM